MAEAADAKVGAMKQGSVLKGCKPRVQDRFGL